MFPVLTILSLLFALICLKNKALGFGLLLSLAPTYLIRIKLGLFPTTVLEILILIFLFVSLFSLKKENLIRIKKLNYLNLWIALFIAAGILSVLVSQESLRALGLFRSFILEPILVFYVSILTLKPDDLRIIFKTLGIGILIVVLFGLVQYMTNLMLPLRFWGYGLEPKRITSFFEYPNALSLYLVPLLGFFIFADLETLQWKKDWKWLWVSLVALALILTFSRGAWGAVLLCLILLLILKKYWVKLSAVVLLLLILVSIPALRSRITINDPSTEAHAQIAKIAIEKIKTDPILGNGLYGFRQTLTDARFPGEILNFPHNIVLNFWLELGLLGLTSFVLIILTIFKDYKKNPTSIGLATLAFILIIIFHGLVDVPFFKNDLSLIFWGILAIFYLNQQSEKPLPLNQVHN